MNHETRPAGVAKGALAGAVAGMVGAAAMAAVMRTMSSDAAPAPVQEKASAMKQGMQQTRKRFADKASEATAGREVPANLEKPVSNAVHFATGAFGGAIYGALAEVDERVTAGHGTAYGVAFGIGSSEIALPAMGLAPPPNQRPLQDHALRLGMHAMYGAVLETVRQPVRNLLE